MLHMNVISLPWLEVFGGDTSTLLSGETALRGIVHAISMVHVYFVQAYQLR